MNDPVINRYIAINNLLKKRFLRKPNVAEARDGFYSLGKSVFSCPCVMSRQYDTMSYRLVLCP